MNTLSDKEHQHRYSEAIRNAQQEGDAAFQNWFNQSQDVKLCKSTGFKVVDSGPSYKTVPDGFPAQKGGQNYVTLVK